MHIVVSIIGVLILLNWLALARRDDTDSEKRSGLILYTDHGTGVQYVGTMLGGITPRLNADGSIHTVAKEEE